MFIKRLIINGFKSFAEKTVIEFKDGVNIILGPNGCGKSNIIDSIRWVLGEQKMKALRASKSEDIIFSGSETKTPSSYTEVGFVLNNDPKLIHSDFPEVAISRKIFRSGESLYSINKKDCRLKDIADLFVDTGLGKTSYSILQQGQIDQILSSKPEERRMIFEEAAGIARSKIMVKESQQKLAKTEENLLRLNDILSEVKKHMDSLKVQAERALEYKTLKTRIQELDKGLFGLRYRAATQKVTEMKEKGEAFEVRVKQVREEMDQVYSRSEEVRGEIGLAEEKIDVFRDKEKNLEMEEYKTNQNILVLRNEHERLKKSFQTLSQKFVELEKRKKEVESFLFSRANEEEELESQIDDYSLNFDQLTSQLFELEESIQSTSLRIQALRNENKTLEQSLTEILKKQKEFFTELIGTIESKKEMISVTLREKNLLKEKINAGLVKLESFFSKWESLRSLNEFEPKQFSEIFSDLKNLGEFSGKFKIDFLQYEKLIQDILDFFEKDGSMVFGEDYNLKIQSTRTRVELNFEEMGQLEGELENKRRSRDTVIRVQSETQVQMNKLKERKINLMSERDKLQKESESLEKLSFDTKRESEDAQMEMENVESEVFALVDAYEKIQDQRRALEREKQGIHQQIMKHTHLLKELETRQRDLSSEMEKVSRGMDKIVIAYQTGLVEKDMIEKSYLEKYGRSIDEIDLSKMDQISPSAAEKEIAESREKLERIGDVNLLAIDEYEEVKNRHEFLFREKDDLETAKRDLEKLIQDVNRQSTESFLIVFDQIEKNFQKVFSKAFNGGRCQLKLADPANPLESGIEIIAQPPGKKLQSITVMSGGERTMTALSIMFAIFMVKPSPFCLLDEVDAALDEANVERLVNIIDDFVAHTQFIIITHNRITAQRGDIFYGVTMQEAGVTKVFSFKPENLEHQFN